MLLGMIDHLLLLLRSPSDQRCNIHGVQGSLMILPHSPLITRWEDSSDPGGHLPPSSKLIRGFPHLLVPFTSSHLTFDTDGECHTTSLEILESSVIGAKAC